MGSHTEKGPWPFHIFMCNYHSTKNIFTQLPVSGGNWLIFGIISPISYVENSNFSQRYAFFSYAVFRTAKRDKNVF